MRAQSKREGSKFSMNYTSIVCIIVYMPTEHLNNPIKYTDNQETDQSVHSRRLMSTGLRSVLTMSVDSVY